jgi:hypothetical protein
MNPNESDQLLLWDFPELLIGDAVLDAIWQDREDRMDEILGRTGLGTGSKFGNLHETSPD